MLSTLALREAGITVTSDASGSWGCGAFWDDFWLQMAWDDSPEGVVTVHCNERDGARHHSLHSVGGKMGRAACPSKIRQ